MKELALYEEVSVISSNDKVGMAEGKIAEEIILLNRKVWKLTEQFDGSEWPFQEKFGREKEEPRENYA